MEQTAILTRRHLMSSSPTLAARRAGAALLTGGAAVGFFAMTRGWYFDAALPMVFSALLGAAAFGFTRRSLGAQVASRAVTWLLFAPTAMATIAQALRGELDWYTIPFALATGTALFVAAPALHTAEAARFFDPVRLRRLFLAGATAMTSAAMIAVAVAADGLRSSAFSPLTVVFNGALALSLVTSVIALLRMRGWGLLLGGATSLVLLAIAPFLRAAEGIALALAATPALLFWVLPVLTSRTRAGTAPVRLRVGSEEAVRTRIATEPDLVAEEELELRPPARAAAPSAPAA
jgi:hypothetical protein